MKDRGFLVRKRSKEWESVLKKEETSFIRFLHFNLLCLSILYLEEMKSSVHKINSSCIRVKMRARKQTQTTCTT